MALATGLLTFFRSFAGLIGVALGSVIINARLAVLLPPILPPNEVHGAQRSAAYIRESLPSEVQPVVIHAYVDAIRTIWLVMAGLACMSVLCVILIKHYTLRRTPEDSNGPSKVFEIDVEA